MLFKGFGPVLTLKLISHTPIPENTRTSQHWKFQLQLCEEIDFIFFSTKEEMNSVERSQQGWQTCCCFGLWIVSGLEMFCLPLSERCFSFPFSDGPLLQKEQSASGFVRHRNSYLHRVMLLNSCSSASYQWFFLLAILSMKLIFIYL